MTLPARRMEWLTGRTKYEMISMIARTGRKAKGAEDTQNKPKNLVPFLTKPRIVTVKNTAIARTTVTAKWEVVVKDIGIRPRKLAQTINMNNVMMYGK